MLGASCGDDSSKPPTPPPAPETFKVGGTITGLSGSLTLQLNGAQDLTRSDNGPFSFPLAVDDQSTYRVALTATPAEQDCTLQGGTGQVNGADVTSVQVSCVTRTYALSGTVEGLTGTLQLRLDGEETLPVTSNGAFTFQTRRPKGGAYTVTVGNQPQGQRCLLSGGTGTVGGNVSSIALRCYPWFELANFQAATRVLGQADFTSNAQHRGGTAGADTLDTPWGNPVFVGGRLYVSELFSNRILGFVGLPTQNGKAADFVLGQPDFMSTTDGAGRAGLAGPQGSSSDGTRFAVAERINNRILLFTTLPQSTGAEASLVLGQPDFTSTGSNCDEQSLNGPEDVFIGQGKQIVADTSNNRLLVWNTLPTVSGAPADLVLGQRSLTGCTENDADGDGTADATPSASTLWAPSGIWTDGIRLMVADTGNHRVLIWNQFPTTHGQPADIVLGQKDFTSGASATTSSGMKAPYLVNSTGLQLFVVEFQNHRVTVWNQFPTTSGQPADVVLGQPDFTSLHQYDPPDGSSPSNRSLYAPSGVLLTWPHVVVADGGNNRLLFFESR